MKLMMFNGLLLFMLFMWTSAKLELESETTGELQFQNYEHESRMEIEARRKACRDLDGKCIKRNRDCPKNRPVKTSPGRPFCNKRRHCCYSEATTSDPLIIGPGAGCPNDNFTRKHVCDNCMGPGGELLALAFTKMRRGNPPEPPIPANTVFYNAPITYAGPSSGKCIISPVVLTYYCTLNSTGLWDTCRNVGYCTGQSDVASPGHLDPKSVIGLDCTLNR